MICMCEAPSAFGTSPKCDKRIYVQDFRLIVKIRSQIATNTKFKTVFHSISRFLAHRAKVLNSKIYSSRINFTWPTPNERIQPKPYGHNPDENTKEKFDAKKCSCYYDFHVNFLGCKVMYSNARRGPSSLPRLDRSSLKPLAISHSAPRLCRHQSGPRCQSSPPRGTVPQ